MEAPATFVTFSCRAPNIVGVCHHKIKALHCETFLVINPFKARFSYLKRNVQSQCKSNFNLVYVIKETLK